MTSRAAPHARIALKQVLDEIYHETFHLDELELRIDKPGAILDISINDLIRPTSCKKQLLILKPGIAFTETTYAVEFTTPSYFSKCIKDQYNITPSEFISAQ